MRAAQLHEIGATPELGEVDAPRRGEGQALVEVTAAALNPVDIAIGTGRFYGGSPDTPYVPGGEAVGRVLEGDRLAPGQRVWFRGSATLAEQAVADEARSVPLPEHVDDAVAVACGIAGVTGWLAVAWRSPVQEDDIVLVLGASGSVGAAAIQGAKLLGAKRVIAAARNTDGLEADAVVKLDGKEEHEPATLIIDMLWGEPAERAVAAAAPGFRLVQVGQSAGPTAALQSAWVRGKVASILGHSLFSIPADVIEAGYLQLVDHAARGRISFEIESYPLDRIGEAWKRQASGSPGAKIVVTP